MKQRGRRFLELFRTRLRMLAQDGFRAERLAAREPPFCRGVGLDLAHQPRHQIPIYLQAEVTPAGQLRESGSALFFLRSLARYFWVRLIQVPRMGSPSNTALSMLIPGHSSTRATSPSLRPGAWMANPLQSHPCPPASVATCSPSRR